MKQKVYNTTNQQNYNAIDIAKFVRAILVVTIHVSPLRTAAETGWTSYLNFGLSQSLARTAVPFFFVTSGFFV